MKEEIDLENFCPWDWIREKAEEMLGEELRKAIEGGVCARRTKRLYQGN